MLMNNNEYLDLVQTIKQEIQQAQYKATLSVNKELIMLYYNCLLYTSPSPRD